mmetsp:Transcript_3511/g.8834  ORF Transcript_3511/g.8834 Transcript_3511/m.8834 type:complete len:208 (+) Transcript_3511:48-671(+)
MELTQPFELPSLDVLPPRVITGSIASSVDSVFRWGDVAQAEVELSTPAIATQTNQEEGLGLSREAPILFGDFLGMFIGPREEAVVEDVAQTPEDVWIEYDNGGAILFPIQYPPNIVLEGGDLADPLVLEGPVNEWPLVVAYSIPVILIDEVLKFVGSGALEVGVDALVAGDEGDAPNSAASEGQVVRPQTTSPLQRTWQTMTNLLEP